MRDEDAPKSRQCVEDTEAILRRRKELQARIGKRLYRLLAAGAATGAAFGTLTFCQPCLSPMPQPGLECSANGPSYDLRDWVSANAQWVTEGPNWEWRVSVSVRSFTPYSFEYRDNDPLVFASAPQLVNATLLQETTSDQNLEFVLEPSPGATAVEVLVILDCDGHTEPLRFSIDVSDLPRESEQLPVEWLD